MKLKTLNFATTTLLFHLGYVAVGLGAFVEGETFVFAAGYLAHEGFFSLSLVIVTATIGAFLGDIFWFYIGRQYRVKALRLLYVRRHLRKVRRWLTYTDWITVPLARFLYGLRIALPILFGMTKISNKKFVFLNACSAPIWAVLIAGAGYGFSGLLTNLFGHRLLWKLVFLAILLILAGLFWLRTLIAYFKE
ncbi:MAG: DedA family protein [Candidatus Desulfofervidaceae bacterium]|nr:DedA family protein [Candidatus Desulfofervidaceae bacterium]